MEILFTIASSIIIFLFCEGIVRALFINPYIEYKKLKSKVAYALTFYANIYSNPEYLGDGVTPSKRYDQASDDLRKIASELRAFIELKPKISIGIPDKEKIYEATSRLIGLSTCLHTAYNVNYGNIQADQNLKRRDAIYDLLKIYTRS